MEEIKLRTCNCCKEVKPLIGNFSSKGIKNGKRQYRYVCNPCDYLKHKDYLRRNPRPKKIREKVPTIKQWFNSYKQTLSCADCGLSFKNQPYLCDFHHRDPKTKSFGVSQIRAKKGKSGVLEEIAKCDSLCSNCHRHRHYKHKYVD